MQTIKELGIDIETYSSVDLPKTGVYPYVESDDFEIMLFSYSINGGDVKLVDLAMGEELPQEITDALTDPAVIKTAFNAAFERISLSKFLGLPKGQYLDPAQWDCTMVRGARLALPLTLEKMGEVLGIEKQKMKEGKALIQYFSKPCKPTKANKGRTRNLPTDAPEKWELYKSYNIRDVEAEQLIRKKVIRMEVTPFERELWICDQRINDRGVLVDTVLAANAVKIDSELKASLMKEAIELTGLENPNSVAQIKEWLEEETGLKIDSLGKKVLPDLIRDIDSESALRLIEIRKQLGKTSVKKYQAMLKAKCSDNRVRGLTQFYGASRTGRWSGRLLQTQNLPQNHLTDLDLARNLVRDTDLETVSMFYSNVPNTLSELIRTGLVAKPGRIYRVCDFSAIEARVIAWIAGEEWVLDVFRNNGDIYCSTASKMFKVPVEKHGANSELRPKGKVATLACIAEGELVFTNEGLVPIQDVKTTQLVWDGEEFVKHEGVIFKGCKEVIEYEGLKATKDHIVFAEVEGECKQVRLGIASRIGAHIVHPIDGWEKTEVLESNTGKVRVYDIRNAGKHHRYTVSNCLVHNCGYQGGVGSLMAMGADKMGLTQEEMLEIVREWRNANKNIVALWKHVEKAVKNCILTGATQVIEKGITIRKKWGGVSIELPSKREIFYPRACINNQGRISYEGQDQQTKKWVKLETYGGKLTENIVQAVARDCLAETMMNVDKAGIDIVFHIHDELVCECRPDQTLEQIEEIFSYEIPWAKGLPLKGAGYSTPYYLKD